MLGPLQAERQLRAIEACVLPSLKPDVANRILERHKKALRPPQAAKSGGMATQLLDAFKAAGFEVEQTTKKPSRRRRDKPGRVER